MGKLEIFDTLYVKLFHIPTYFALTINYEERNLHYCIIDGESDLRRG